MNAENARGSRAHAPDLDWSQVRETVLMLELSAGQIEAALSDSSASVDVLTDTFTSMAGSLASISQAVAALPEIGAEGAAKHQLADATQQVSGLVHRSIIAFQFYDKLSQRLAHVCHSLAKLSDLVADRARIFNPEEWVQLQATIRAKYTTPDECQMFESVMAGMPVQEAIAHYLTQLHAHAADNDDVELF